jgi:hypothetical protein
MRDLYFFIIIILFLCNFILLLTIHSSDTVNEEITMPSYEWVCGVEYVGVNKGCNDEFPYTCPSYLINTEKKYVTGRLVCGD